MISSKVIKNIIQRSTSARFLSRSPRLLNEIIKNENIEGFNAFEDLIKGSIEESKEEEKLKSFPKLLRESKFVKLGNFTGRIVYGKIVHRVNDDLYIDIGLKFNAVVKAPKENGNKFIIGKSVIMKLFDPELSEKFLGSKKSLTLLEADAKLLKLVD
uniref:S1 motif domain-containing protein n=1 Tax=Parastrongyloides trichosuri TaxID=131310 RepID=A0A0N4ZKL5_PARTI